MEYLPLKLEIFGADKEFPLVIEYGYHNNNMYLHSHLDFDELTIVLSGNATHIVNNERYMIHKGDVFVVGSDLVHGFENPSNFKICNIMYRPEIISRMPRDVQKSTGYHALFVLEPYISRDFHFTSKLQLTIPAFETTSLLIANLIQEYQNHHIGRITMLSALLWNLIVHLSREYQIEDKPKDSLLNLAIPLAYMNKNFREAITVSTLAQQAHMSTRNFSRVFHKAYGISPINYLIQLRIQHAYELLHDSTISISEIAYLCGFQDSNYFTRQFKQASGFTPKAYRHFLLDGKNM